MLELLVSRDSCPNSDKRNAFADVHDTEAKEMMYSRTVAGGRMLRDLV
jgi:hypothetical protein